MARLDKHAETIKAALPELAHKLSEYVIGGRYFQIIEIPEGARLTNTVIDLVGAHVLMYASDYPHSESHFPQSTSLVLDWAMDAERKRKLLWDNAVRSYTRSGRRLRVKPRLLNRGHEHDRQSQNPDRDRRR
jgi:predicted TIM-barrel fold metal-dependent hydrolase